MEKPPWLFPYVEDPSAVGHYPDGTREVLRPIVNVRVEGMKDQLLALVDSGSERTLLAPWIARDAELDLGRAIRQITLGIGGDTLEVDLIECRLSLIPPGDLEAEPITWEAEVGVIVRNWRPPWQMLLGQIGFFDHFTISMHRHAHVTAIEPYERFDERFGVYIEEASQRQRRPV
jgi:hypothetical protein